MAGIPIKNFRCFSCNSSLTIQVFQFNCKSKQLSSPALLSFLCQPPTKLAGSEGYPIKHVFLDFLSSHPFPWQEGYLVPSERYPAITIKRTPPLHRNEANKSKNGSNKSSLLFYLLSMLSFLASQDALEVMLVRPEGQIIK